MSATSYADWPSQLTPHPSAPLASFICRRAWMRDLTPDFLKRPTWKRKKVNENILIHYLHFSLRTAFIHCNNNCTNYLVRLHRGLFREEKNSNCLKGEEFKYCSLTKMEFLQFKNKAISFFLFSLDVIYKFHYNPP